jgi:hypothetical protein
MQPPMAPPPPPAAAPASNDKTTLFGVLGIVFAFCCGPLGIVFGVLSMNAAKKVGKPQTLGIVAIVLGVLSIIGGIVYQVALRN